MSDLVLMVDVEQLVTGFLLDQAEVAAFFAANAPHDRVYTALPKDKTWPLIRVTRFGGAPVFSRPLHLDKAALQIDAFGGSKRLAWQIAETCRAVIGARLVGSHPEGVVTKVDFGEAAPRPDEAFTPPKPMFEFLLFVWCHPYRTGGS